MALHIYPVRDAPGVELTQCLIEPDGLAGDRRKKSPVYLVAADQVTLSTRANVVLDISAEHLASALGSTVRMGAAVIHLGPTTSHCQGAYAQVLAPGMVRVGDVVEPWTDDV